MKGIWDSFDFNLNNLVPRDSPLYSELNTGEARQGM